MSDIWIELHRLRDKTDRIERALEALNDLHKCDGEECAVCQMHEVLNEEARKP